MLRTILIGLDGSAYSHNAIELGIRWAKEHGSLLAGLGIVDEPTIRKPAAVPLGGASFKEERDEAVLELARRQVETFLQHFMQRCAEAGVAAERIADVGEPYEQILWEAQAHDLIILGKQTYFHFQTQEGPCETLKKVLKNSPRPVVTVPEKLFEGETIVVAYDASLQAARALYGLEASGVARKRMVHVVSVDPKIKESVRRADMAVQFLKHHELRAEAHPVATTEPPAAVLLQQAARLNADLLVMGAYGQPTLREFFLGSMTRSLLKETTIPLFLFH